jgi:arginase
MKRTLKIIKNRSDIGAGTRGSDMGIDALEIAAIVRDNHFFNEYPFEDVPTHNESIYNKDKNTFAKRIGHVLEQCQRVAGVIARNLQERHFPLLLSGDHSAALGTISGIKMAYPDQRLGVVWIDAHADLHSPYTSPSGNIHGMPLAAALGEDNLTDQINELTPETYQNWQGMKKIGSEKAKIQPTDLIYFGVRDTETPEDQQMDRLGIRNYQVHELRYRGLETCLQEALEQLQDCPLIYVSFDVDAMDCDMVSFGTGTPVSKGFDPDEVVAIIQNLLHTGKVVCLEVVEINPLLDTKGNKMAETAFDIIDQLRPSLG